MDKQTDPTSKSAISRIIDVDLDEASIGRNTKAIEHERDVAIYDLLENNYFALLDKSTLSKPYDGPFTLRLSIQDKRLVMHIGDTDKNIVTSHYLSLSPFRRIIKDYFIVCESYFEAIKTASPARIEAIDMGRKGLHDEGGQILMKRLDGKIDTDFETARRLFTLVCALHWKG